MAARSTVELRFPPSVYFAVYVKSVTRALSVATFDRQVFPEMELGIREAKTPRETVGRKFGSVNIMRVMEGRNLRDDTRTESEFDFRCSTAATATRLVVSIRLSDWMGWPDVQSGRTRDTSDPGELPQRPPRRTCVTNRASEGPPEMAHKSHGKSANPDCQRILPLRLPVFCGFCAEWANDVTNPYLSGFPGKVHYLRGPRNYRDQSW